MKVLGCGRPHPSPRGTNSLQPRHGHIPNHAASLQGPLRDSHSGTAEGRLPWCWCRDHTANHRTRPNPNNQGVSGQSTAGTRGPCGTAGLGGQPCQPGQVAPALLPCRRREGGFATAGCCGNGGQGLSGALSCSTFCGGPGEGDPGPQHRGHWQAEEPEARCPTWLGERHHTGEVAPGRPQRAAERISSVKASMGTPQPCLHPGAAPSHPSPPAPSHPTPPAPISGSPVSRLHEVPWHPAGRTSPTSGRPCRGVGRGAAGSAQRLQIQLAGS